MSRSCAGHLYVLCSERILILYVAEVESQRNIILRFLSNISTRIYARPVDRIISGARSAPNGMHFLVHIYNYRGAPRARECTHSRCLTPRHPVSCLCCFSFFSLMHGRPRDSTRDRQTLHDLADALCTYCTEAGRIGTVRVVWQRLEKLLRMISMRPWFSSKSLKYLRICSTFRE